MFDEFESDHTKTITMSMRDSEGNEVVLTNHYNFDTSWPKISYQFFCFLRGMGYQLDHEAVSADVGDE